MKSIPLKWLTNQSYKKLPKNRIIYTNEPAINFVFITFMILENVPEVMNLIIPSYVTTRELSNTLNTSLTPACTYQNTSSGQSSAAVKGAVRVPDGSN